MAEADVHFEFYRHIRNALDDNLCRGKITYDYAKPEHKKEISDRANIVVSMEKEDKLGEDLTIASRIIEKHELGTAVLGTLGIVDRLDELKQAIESLVRNRDEESVRSAEVLIERVQRIGQRGEAIYSSDVESARESTILGDF